MSLMSLISQSGYSSGSATTALPGTTAIKEAASKAAATPTATSAAATDRATISDAAREKADNAKDFTALSKEVRATLDSGYAKAKAAGTTDPAPDLSNLSGRALSAIVLNKSGSFSKAESRAAKSALNSQLRTSFVNAGATYGTSMSGLASFGSQLVSQYDGMSAEERQARGWTESFRASNAGLTAMAGSSLFDQISDD